MRAWPHDTTCKQYHNSVPSKGNATFISASTSNVPGAFWMLGARLARGKEERGGTFPLRAPSSNLQVSFAAFRPPTTLPDFNRCLGFPPTSIAAGDQNYAFGPRASEVSRTTPGGLRHHAEPQPPFQSCGTANRVQFNSTTSTVMRRRCALLALMIRPAERSSHLS